MPRASAVATAAAVAMLGIAVRSERLGPWPTVLSITVAGAQVTVAYPEVIGAELVLVCQLLTAAWFVGAGLLLLRPVGRSHHAND